jgi:protein-disulfide isomerase
MGGAVMILRRALLVSSLVSVAAWGQQPTSQTQELRKLQYFYRDFPLPFHEHATSAAQAARCAGEQGKFWEMHDSLFDEPTALSTADVQRRAGALGIDVARFNSCLDTHPDGTIQKSVAEATQMQISGTPTFLIGTIAPNGDIVNVRQTMVGAYPFEAFKEKIEPLLAGKASGG